MSSLLTDRKRLTGNKYTVFTADADPLITEKCDQQEANIWLSSDIKYTQDLHDLKKMSPSDINYITQILGFFAASDGIVNQNIALNFASQVKVPEVAYFYYFQMMMEAVHAKTYSQLINTFIDSQEERNALFTSIENHPIIKKKADWCFKWMDDKNNFYERMVAFLAVEGIFFAGSFAAIFWLRDRGILANSLGVANEYISRDETLHAEFACLILNKFSENEKPSKSKITDILLSALELEKEFTIYALPDKLFGINQELMIQYLKFVTDSWLEALDCEKVFNVLQPFSFMKTIGQRRKDNIFEKTGTNYARQTQVKTLDFELL
jgi:ribonucleoside-diphosphate reductase beta chain